MTDLRNCQLHGQFRADYPDRCPSCILEEYEREDREEARLAQAAQETTHRQTNPGDYECPHCGYISLKRDKTRCPLCRGEIGSEYWNTVRARERADAQRRAAALEVATEQRRAMEEAAKAERIRTAPERAAAAEAARLVEEHAATVVKLQHFGEFLIATVVGAIIGVVAGVIVGIVVFAIGSVAMQDATKGAALAHNVAYVVVVIGAAWGAVLGWVRPWKD